MVRDKIETAFMTASQIGQIDRLLPDERTTRLISEFYAVFSDTMRIRIISALAISEMCVSDLAELLGAHQSTVSHQLSLLKRFDIVDYRREGKMIVYFVSNVLVEDVMGLGIENIKNNWL